MVHRIFFFIAILYSGIILEGGVKVNVIPAKTRLHVGIRAPTDAQLARLKEKAMNVIEAAAKATECQVRTERAVVQVHRITACTSAIL